MNYLLNKIHNCDNREILKQIPNKSIQVFLEDMPYGITACHWDKMPDLKEYWDLRLSKIKDNGCFVLFSSQPFTTDLINSNRKMFKQELIWEKSRGTNFLHLKKQHNKIHENILLFYNKQCIYNPIKYKVSEKYIDKRKNKLYRNHEKSNTKTKLYNIKQKENYKYIDIGERYPESILRFESINTEFIKHSSMKPVLLFEYLIKTYSNENDLIFDGFSGSGTTAIASYNTNRNFICCELEKEYYDKSVERLNEVKNNLFDFVK